jgi:murein DD-endopeptidase MepM/ murein hydrolase activator NlpD
MRSHARTNTGTPPSEDHFGNFYIWRTEDDEKVRAAHAERDDLIFRWDDPPKGGHPGEDYNCRCRAEPLSMDELLPYDFFTDSKSLRYSHLFEYNLLYIYNDMVKRINQFKAAERDLLDAIPESGLKYRKIKEKHYAEALDSALDYANSFVKAAREVMSERTQSITQPVPGGMTDKFYRQYDNEKKKPHEAIDYGGRSYGVKHFTPVVAPEKGIIEAAGVQSTGESRVRIRFEDDIRMSFVHVYPVVVAGQTVEEGQIIGFIDDSGVTSGPHAHIIYYPVPSNMDIKADPAIYFKARRLKPYPWKDVNEGINEPYDILRYTGTFYRKKGGLDK